MVVQAMWGDRVRRRKFIALLGDAVVAWPFRVTAQQSTTPVIGFLSSRSKDEASGDTAAFHQGLNEMGYVVTAIKVFTASALWIVCQWQPRRQYSSRPRAPARCHSRPTAAGRSKLR